MKDGFFINFDNGLPKGTAQQKGERIVKDAWGVPKIQHYRKSNVATARQLFAYQLKAHKPTRPLEGCVFLKVCFYFDVKEASKWGKYKPTRPDLDNYVKELKDAMTDVGFWADDNQVVRELTEKRYAEKGAIYIYYEEVAEK